MSEHRDFKFGVPVYHRESQPTEDKLSLKGAWSHLIHFKFLVPPKIILEQLKLETSVFVHWFAVFSISLQIDKYSPQVGMMMVT